MLAANLDFGADLDFGAGLDFGADLEPAERTIAADAEDLQFTRGLLYAFALSVPIWGVIIGLAWLVF